MLEISLAGATFGAHLLHDQAPRAVVDLLGMLPLTATARQDQWSKDMMLLRSPELRPCAPLDEAKGFQYPGLLVHACDRGELALCYGEARFQDDFGYRRAAPIAAITARLGDLEAAGRALQFDGAKPVTIRRAPEGSGLAHEEAETPGDRFLTVRLGDSESRAVLLDSRSPSTVAELIQALPIRGRATNTISSGPLTRVWDDRGGPEGNTPLGVSDEESKKLGDERDPRERRWGTVLWPGYLYYKATGDIRGIRIAAVDATMMKGVTVDPGSKMVPFARFVGDWSGFRAVAADLSESGAQPISIDLVS